MDIKIAKKNNKRSRRRNGPRKALTNSMILSTSWTEGPMTASTTGSIASTIGVSISNAPEYSSLASLFTEVKILKATIFFTPKASTSNTGTAVLQGRVWVGTNMLYNSNFGTTPTDYKDVLNLPNRKVVVTSSVRPTSVRLKIPPGLEFANIAADAPSTVTPWAGSPGVWQVYGGSLSASQEYFDLDIRAVYQLRGRQ